MPPRLEIGQKIKNPLSGETYVIETRLGSGGFGAAYRARSSAGSVCLKVTSDSGSWHREAYMGELLHRESGVVTIYDTFQIARDRGKVMFAVVMELGTDDVAHAVRGSGWPERKVIAETRRLFTAIRRLHASGAATATSPGSTCSSTATLRR